MPEQMCRSPAKERFVAPVGPKYSGCTADMEMNYALEDEEVEEGYVLTCQALPTSEKVVISYDE